MENLRTLEEGEYTQNYTYYTKVKTQWNGGTTWSKWSGNCNALQSESTGTLVSHSNSVSPRTSAFSSHAICLNFTLQPCLCVYIRVQNALVRYYIQYTAAVYAVYS